MIQETITIQVITENTLLFNRLFIMAKRDEWIQDIFRFELAPVPVSLFTVDHVMRKP